LEEVEDALIAADLGTASAIRLATALKAHKFDGPVDADSIALALADGLEAILKPVAKPLVIDAQNRPHVVLLVGVNGSGENDNCRQAGAKLASRRQDRIACRWRYISGGGC
jgi:fused signal recognition particle receptor